MSKTERDTAQPESDLIASVVVVAYRQARALPSCLAAVANQSVPRQRYEIIVVDNGDNGDARAASAGTWDHWLETGANLGCSGGRNRGTATARAPVTFFVDDDGRVDRDFLAAGLVALVSDPYALAVRGRVVPKDHWLLTTLLDGCANFGPRSVRNVSYELEGASCVRTAAFLALGGFDKALAGGEGRDLIVRAKHQDAATVVLYEPSMILAHDYVRGVKHFLYKARRNAIALERAKQGDALPTYNPPPGTFDAPDWKPPMPLRVARRMLSRSTTQIGRIPYSVREPK
jgi:glycosyltransferase involved in cell wall biosynthesis